MNRSTFIFAAIFCFLLQNGYPSYAFTNHPSPSRAEMLRYDEPVNEWALGNNRVMGLPLGNGQMGMMFTGGALRDIFLLNHDMLLTNDHQENNTPASQSLNTVRSLALSGQWENAQNHMDQLKQEAGCHKTLNVYHPLGWLVLEMDLEGPAENYQRSLDLSRGTGEVRFRAGTTEYTRTYFVSAADQAAIIHIAANRPKSIHVELALGRDPYKLCSQEGKAKTDELTLQGTYIDGVTFDLQARILTSGGHSRAVKTPYHGFGARRNECLEKLISVRVDQADEVLILISTEVDHPVLGRSRSNLPAEKDASFARLLERHIADHAPLFNRADIHLGQTNASDLSVLADRLIHQAYLGHPSPRLFELIFQMGRYLLISGSRPGSRALNLQGIWNDSYHPPWQCRYQLDINLQMCYWLANVGNLSECNAPLFALLDRLKPAAQAFAKDLYGYRGILLGIATDGMNIRYFNRLETPSIAGWLANHYWQHYEFTQDTEFLAAKAFPFLREAALFLEDYLTEDEKGRYRILPSTSPENRPSNRNVNLSKNATFDIAVARELFTNTANAAEALQIDADRIGTWREIAKRLPEWPIGSDGALREWNDPEAKDQEHHRHLTHLYPLHPGALFTPETTPELMEAARNALDKRVRGMKSDACGWTYAWLVCQYARLGDGETAYQHLMNLSRGFLMDNFMTSMGDWRQQGLGRRRNPAYLSHAFQIEAGLGAAAGIAEMLLQSHGGIIRILPALPKAWPEGHVQGLLAQGGFELDFCWAGGIIQNVNIVSRAGRLCRLKLCRPLAEPLKLYQNENLIFFRQPSPNLLEFETEPHGRYILTGNINGYPEF